MSNLNELSNNNLCNALNNIYINNMKLGSQTYQCALAIIGFSSSCIAFGIFMISVQRFKHPIDIDYTMFNYAFMVIAAACNLQLYNGLSTKQYKVIYWILLKCTEFGLVLIALIDNSVSYYPHTDFIISAIFILCIVLLQIVYIIRKIVKSSHIQPKLVAHLPVDNITKHEMDKNIP